MNDCSWCLSYLKHLQLLQGHLLTLAVLSGQMDGLQDEAGVCRQHDRRTRCFMGLFTHRTAANISTRSQEQGRGAAHTPTCADEQDVVGAIHGLHPVHQQFAELVVHAHSDQEGALSQRQHIFLQDETVQYHSVSFINILRIGLMSLVFLKGTVQIIWAQIDIGG